MRLHIALAFAGMVSISAWYGVRGRSAQPPVMALLQLPGGGEMPATMVGHQFRQDDLPAVAASPDGSLWIAWLSFVGDRDDVVIRHYMDGQWSNLQWVPNTSGDSWLPQVAVDAQNRPWVVWSQQVNGNWDLYARRYDPKKQEWGSLERLTTDPMPDINPRLTSDGKGNFALVWQGFRGKNSNIFLKTFDGEKWSADMRVTNRPANDWEPAVAIDSKAQSGSPTTATRTATTTSSCRRCSGREVGEARWPWPPPPAWKPARRSPWIPPDRVWVAWEEGSPNWGKDNGYWFRKTGSRRAARRRAPAARPLPDRRRVESSRSVARSRRFPGNAYQPAYLLRRTGLGLGGGQVRTVTGDGAGRAMPIAQHFEYWVSHLDGNAWSKAMGRCRQPRAAPARA